MSARVILLVPWIGREPNWAPQFWDRIEASSDLVHLVFLQLKSWSSFRRTVRQRLDLLPPAQASPRKICDYRPAFGEIYDYRIEGYEWWGWCDMDCVFGDFAAFLTPERLAGYDLITDHASIVNGPFTIMRNTPEMTSLYRRGGHYREVFISPEHAAWDEVGFSEIVQRHANAEWIRPLFLNAHTHDHESPTPYLLDNKLYATHDREILTYHFAHNKRWPL